MVVSPSVAVAIPALALSLGWGIRGQFGGRHGAAIAGALFGLTVAAVFGHAQAISFAGVCAVAMSFGGTMTYGQTIRRAHDSEDAAAYGWAMFGLTVKGVVWIGVAGAWIGIAAGHRAYSLAEIVVLIIGQVVVGLVGVGVVNRPHEPPDRMPKIYFSDRESESARVEWWGGLLFGYLALMLYLAVVKEDLFAFGLGVFGAFGGLGFPLGQSIQMTGRSFRGFSTGVQRWVDWWKVMELTFGLAAGGALGFGWWLLDRMGFAAGLAPLPSAPIGVQVTLVCVYGVLFVATMLGSNVARIPLMAPFVGGVLLLPAVVGDGIGGVCVVGVLLCAVSASGVARQLLEDEVVGRAVAILVGVLGTLLGVVFAWRYGTSDTRTWLLFVVWFHTIATALLKGLNHKYGT